MSQFKFEIDRTEFTIQDVGGFLNQEFVHLHEHFLTKQPFDYLQFEKAAHSYFDSNIGVWDAHDAFFNNFTIIWRWLLELGRFAAAEDIWEFALTSATNWEINHPSQRLHKGTPYYFWGQKQDQAFRNKVQEVATFLDELLAEYRRARGKALTLDEFRVRLFDIADLRDPVFLFVFTLFKMKTLLRGVRLRLRTNDFADLLETGLLFDLCLVIDSVIGYKNRQSWRFIDHAAYLSLACQFNLNRDRLVQLNSAWG